jgi:hypothetical protein
MANFFTIDYEDTTPPASGTVSLNYGYSYSSGLIVNVSMFAGSGFTPTHYKLWGLELVEGEGVVTSGTATWQAFPASGKTTAILDAEVETPQYASVKYKDAGENETAVFTSNGVSFNFVEPVISNSTTWKNSFAGVNFDSVTANILENANYATEVEFNKNNIKQLKFSGRTFTGLKIEPDTITVRAGSQIEKLIDADPTNHVTVSKTFGTSDRRMISVSDGGSFSTLTTYSGTNKTGIPVADEDRLDSVSWDSGNKKITFDAYEFSTYGFTTINSVEFTADSMNGGYTGTTMTFRVRVKDTNGDLVELAPVTISGTGDNIGTIQESMPVNTNASGIAEFSIPLTAEGIAYFSASVDDTYFSAISHSIFSMEMPATQRSLLTQLEQIFKTETYDDEIADVNTQAVAEPSSTTASGSPDSVLEHDLNVLRTLIRQVKFGTTSGTNWYDSLGNYFDPTDTDSGDSENKEFSMTAIKNKTLDANVMILAVDDSNSGNGFTITAGDDGFLFTSTTDYATPENRTGLPIFKSTTNSGSYWDEGGLDRVVGIDIINMDTGAEFYDASGNVVFGKFHDAADHSGTGTGTDVYVKFYTSEGEYTTTSGDPTSVMIVYPLRKVLSDVEEYEWNRTTFVSSWEGDAAIVEDISNLWSYTGATNNATSPSWTSISGSPMVDSSHLNLWSAIEALNDDFGDRTWTTVGGYLSDGESITDSLDALDIALYDLSQNTTANIPEIYIEAVASDISKGTAHDTPVAYTPDNTTGREGKNMDVFLDGQLLAPSTGVNGANYDRDYAETSTTQITFHFDVYEGSNITYKVRQ